MYDDFFDKLNETTPEPQENRATEDTLNTNPYTAPQTPVQPIETPQQDTIYSDSYAEMYRPSDATPRARTYNPFEDSFAESEPAPQAPQAHQSAPASDGYYYRSFTRHEEPEHKPAPVRKEPKQKKSGMGKGAVAALLIVCILFSGAAGFGGSILASKLNLFGQNASVTETTANNASTGTSADSGYTKTASVTSDGPDLSTAEITEIAAPSVVEITTEIVQTSDFYGQYVVQGAGSGVIINENGTIITNNHVIEDSEEVTVTLRTGESFEGKVIGTDEELDIALVKIEPGDTKLSVATIGDSDTLNVGDKSVIIGNPLGTLGGSVTEGIISALDRSIVIDNKTMNLMQTDAAINAGNSGGGMFNGQGQLVGIVVAKNASGEVDNIGFVIPINAAKTILGDLEDFGYVRGKADTGMTFVDVSNALYAYYYFRSGNPGCYVSSVDSGSNAEKAGFRAGDRIVAIDGKDSDDPSDVKEVISEKSVGDEVSFEIERQGNTATLTLKLEEKIPEIVR